MGSGWVIAAGAEALHHDKHFARHKIGRQFRIEVRFTFKAQHLVALATVKVRVYRILIRMMSVECIFHRVVMQHDPMNDMLLLQGFEGAVKGNPVEQFRKRFFNLLLRQGRVASQQFGQYKLPATGIFELMAL